MVLESAVKRRFFRFDSRLFMCSAFGQLGINIHDITLSQIETVSVRQSGWGDASELLYAQFLSSCLDNRLNASVDAWMHWT